MSDKPKFNRGITTPTVRVNGNDKPGIVSHVTESSNGDIESLIALCSGLTARERVCELIEIHEKDTSAIIEDQRSKYASGTERTTLRLALDYADRIKQLERSIAHFEKYTDDSGDLSRFYETLSISLELAGDLEILTLKRYAKEIVRGDDESYDGKGATTNVQLKGVNRVYELIGCADPMKKTEAVLQVAEEFGKSKSTIFEWLKKYPQ